MTDKKNLFYVHLHNHDEDGKLLHHGGCTICYSVHNNYNVVHYTIAKCNNIDRFAKRIGRNISSGRLLKGDFQKMAITANSKHSDIIPLLINEYYDQQIEYQPDVHIYVK